MADFGTTTGIGTGIGEAMREIGAGLAERGKRRDAERDKQAGIYEKQAQDIAANIVQLGGMNAPGAAPYLQQLNQVISRHNALYPMHETPALINRIRQFTGRSRLAPTPDERAGLTSEEMIAAAPRFPAGQRADLQTEIAQMDQALAQAYPDLEATERKQRAFELVAGGRQSGAKNTVEQMNEHAEAYAQAHPELPHEQGIAEGRLDFMRTGTGASPRYTLQGQLNVHPDGSATGLFVNPQNPNDFKVQTYPPGSYTPKVSKGGAAYKMNYRKDAEGNDVLTSITAADGTVYNQGNIGDAPENISQAWDIEQQRLTGVVSAKRQDLLEKREFQVKLAQTQANIREQAQKDLIPYQENKSYDIAEFRAAQTEANKSQDAFNKTKDLWSAAQNADQSRNAQADLAFVEALQKEIASGRSSQASIEALMTHGTLKQRLADVYTQILGGQQMDEVIREHLVELARSLYNSRLDTWQKNEVTRDRIRERTQGGGGGGGGGGGRTPIPNPKGYSAIKRNPTTGQVVGWDGKDWYYLDPKTGQPTGKVNK